MLRPRSTSPDPFRPDAFQSSQASFEKGFDEFKARPIDGRAMIRANRVHIALEVCADSGADGEELCREYYGYRNLAEIVAIVKHYVATFLAIVEEKKLHHFVIAIMTDLETEFFFEFSCNRNALIKYHWDSECHLLNVEVPRHYPSAPANLHCDAAIKFGTPPVYRNTMSLLYEDPCLISGRRIFSPRTNTTHQGEHMFTYIALYDNSRYLATLVKNRFRGKSMEVMRRNMENMVLRKDLPEYITRINRTSNLECALLTLDRYEDIGHLMIYAEKKKIALHCRVQRNHFLIERKIFEFERPYNVSFNDSAADNKLKVEMILEYIWTRKILQYTISFEEIPQFPIMLRYEKGSRNHTQIRHHWNFRKRVNCLTVVHAGRTDTHEYLRETPVHVRSTFLWAALQDLHLAEQRPHLTSSWRVYKEGSERYSTKSSEWESPVLPEPELPDQEDMTHVILTRRQVQNRRSCSLERRNLTSIKEEKAVRFKI